MKIKHKKIPINYLDKVKYELNKVNSPQYFFIFWQLKANINHELIYKAFNKSLKMVDKLNYVLEENGELIYKPKNYKNNCILEETEKPLQEELIEFLENRSFDVIEKSESAPIILVHLRNRNRSSSILLLMVNHIFADAGSAYSFYELLVRIYNAYISENKVNVKKLISVSDNEIINIFTKNCNLYEIKEFNYQLEEIKKFRLNYKSDENIIKKIYFEQNKNKKIYFLYKIVEYKNIKNKNNRVNSVISAGIIKAFLQQKSGQINQTVSVAMPANIRGKKKNLFGNFVNSISIKVANPKNIQEIISVVENSIDEFKRPYRPIASYALTAMLSSEMSSSELHDLFRVSSLKHHFYISNYGKYNYNNDPDLQIIDSTVLSAGGFNFPLQAHFGLVFTLVPFNDAMGIGVAFSPLVAEKEEMEDLLDIVRSVV